MTEKVVTPHRNLESAASEGCEYCRAPEPVVCEGFCVHCGNEVSPAHLRSTATPDSTAAARSASFELMYTETLRVSWFLLWRPLCMLAVIGAVVPGAGTLRAPIFLGLAAAALLGVFIVMPWLVRSMLQKRFRGFSLIVTREQEGTDSK